MTSLSFLAIVIFGLFSLSRLPVDLYPDIETNTIMVLTAYPGASASDIENNVSRPLESVLNTIGNLKHITSRSSENMSLIQMQFEYGHDINELTNDVRDKLDMISSSLPDNVETPVIFKFSSDMIPIRPSRRSLPSRRAAAMWPAASLPLQSSISRRRQLRRGRRASL